jgi:hypothetical protein
MVKERSVLQPSSRAAVRARTDGSARGTGAAAQRLVEDEPRLPLGGARVDQDREAGDHAVALELADAVGRRVGAEADGGAE